MICVEGPSSLLVSPSTPCLARKHGCRPGSFSPFCFQFESSGWSCLTSPCLVGSTCSLFNDRDCRRGPFPRRPGWCWVFRLTDKYFRSVYVHSYSSYRSVLYVVIIYIEIEQFLYTQKSRSFLLLIECFLIECFLQMLKKKGIYTGTHTHTRYADDWNTILGE